MKYGLSTKLLLVLVAAASTTTFSNLDNPISLALAVPGVLVGARLLSTGYHDDRLLYVANAINLCVYFIVFWLAQGGLSFALRKTRK